MEITPRACRVCLKKDETNINIFEFEDDIQYSSKLSECTGIPVSEDDKLPSSICCPCASELDTAYKFVIKCKTTDRGLRDHKISLTDLGTNQNDIKKEIEIDVKYEYDNFPEMDNLSFTLPDDELAPDAKIEVEYDLKRSRKKKRKKTIKNTLKIKRKKKTIKNTLKIKRKEKNNCGLECSICQLSVNSKSALLIHWRTHTGEKPYSCNQCSERFPSKGMLKRHTEIAHLERERKFTCETCGNRFYRKNDIIIHMRRHTGETPYPCPFCPRRFQQHASLTRHKRTHTGDKPFPCDVCGKRFADKSMVKKHLLVHSNERKFQCSLCDKAVKSKSALNAHMNIHSNEKANVCEQCGNSFAAKGNLKMHIQKVHSEHSGFCTICDKQFSNLDLHMRKHTGETPFSCQVCARSFVSKGSLAHHILFKHENASKYKCTISECSKSFPMQSMLEFHLLKHHKHHTPYVCQHCGRGFFRNSDLSRHLKISHIEQCSILRDHKTLIQL